VAAFYLDAAPIAQRLMWDQSEALETFGIERDLVHSSPCSQPTLATDHGRVGIGRLQRNEVMIAPVELLANAGDNLDAERFGGNHG
jgi:hypothetical protein